MKEENKGGNKPEGKKKKALNLRQKQFCREYVKNGGNAAEAYRAAGYGAIGATQNGQRLKAMPEVQAYIRELAEPAEAADIADAQEVLRYLTAVLRGESVSETVIIEGTGKGKSRARAMERKPEEKERLEAAKTLAKIKGMYTNSVDIGGVFVQIVDDIPEGAEE